MPTLNKLEYLDETKGQIKDALNTNFNSGITEEDTFRSYVSKISDIYTNWPKVEGEGTDLSLSNTKKGLMKVDLKGNTQQNGTPTPDTPIDIQVVSGDNSIKVEGKNLFDGFRELYTGSTYENGTLIAQGVCRGNYLIPRDNRTYYFNYNVASSVRYYVAEYDENKNEIRSNVKYEPQSFTIGNDAKYFSVIFAFVGGTTYPVTISNIQLELGTSSSTYTPYVSQTYPISLGNIELCKIGDYQDSIVKDNGKWYLNKQIGKVVFDENSHCSTYTYNNMLGVNFFGSLSTNRTRASGICNYSNKVGQWSSNSIWIGVNDTNIYWLNILNLLSISTIADFKTWLSTNNVIIYYVLATPTYTEITDSTLLGQLNNLYNANSYEGTTNVSQVNDDLGFIISASALMKGGN